MADSMLPSIKIMMAVYNPDPQPSDKVKQAEMRTELRETTLPRYVGYCEALIRK